MKLSRLILSSAVCLASVAAAKDAPNIRAKVGEPAIPDTMGGCSMRCTFRWEVEAFAAGSTQPTKVTVLNDEVLSPAWTAPGGVGVKLTFAFPKKIHPEMEGLVPFYGLDIVNGDWTEESWKDKARVKKAKISYNGKPHSVVTFTDTRKWQHIEFEDIMIQSGDVMTFEILEIYPSAKDASVAISEFVLQGAH